MPMHTSTTIGVVQDMFLSLDRINWAANGTTLAKSYLGTGGPTSGFV
jgi:hypothetical protein